MVAPEESVTPAEPPRSHPPVHRVLRPRRSWLPTDPGELWEFREVLLRMAARDVTLRYRQAALGATWVVLQPLLGAGLLAFAFGTVADLPSPAGVSYFVFTLVGMVAWTAFSSVATRASGSLLANAAMIQKVFVPRMLLPLSTVAATMLDVLVTLALLAVALVLGGDIPGLAVLTLPGWLLLAVAIGLGLGLASSALMVKYRDVQQVLPVAVQLLLFATPVAYSLADVPAGAQTVVKLNPLTGVLEGMRWAALGTPAPSAGLVAWSVGGAVLSLVIGAVLFSRLERTFADVI